jgi:perosamine synthetase
MIPHNKPCMDKNDAISAYNTILSKWIAYGEQAKVIENKISNYIFNNPNYAVATSSGTSALYLALYALGVNKNDEVILPSYTCSAVLNAIMLIGAIPVLVDIDDKTLGLNYESVKKNITKKTKAIIFIHTYGIPTKIDSFKKFNIPIIEDCSQSLGSKYEDGSKIGSKGDIAIFSFYATKVISGGYGGMVLSRNKNYIAKIRDYIEFDQPKNYYPRFNFLLSDINASIINSQFDKLDSFLEKRKFIAQKYNSVINDKFKKYSMIKNQNYHRYLISLESKKQKKSIKKLFYKNNISVINPLTPKELLHNYLKKNKKEFYHSIKASKFILSIPIFPCLKENEINKIIDVLKEIK